MGIPGLLDSLYLVAGPVLGCVFMVPVPAAANWTSQVALARGRGAALEVAAGIALAQGAAALVAISVLTSVIYFSATSGWTFTARVCSFLLLAYMALQLRAAPELDRLRLPPERVPAGPLFWPAFSVAVKMPYRLLGFLAHFTAVGLQNFPPLPLDVPVLALGVTFGSYLWLAMFAVLAAWADKEVPDAITLRSLKKVRKLGVLVLAGLAALSLTAIALGVR